MAETEVTMSGNSGGTSGDTEIDLYADVVENELDTGANDDYIGNDEHLVQDGDLYDDVITTQSSATDFTDITNTVNQNINKLDQSNGLMTGRNTPSNSYNGKRVSLYVGQLTWWTTDSDISDVIQELGISDLLEVKFHENRVNGQSKGFAVVTVGSEASSRIILEKIPKREIHGQNPTVLPCNKQSLSFFEGVTRKDAPIEPMPPMNAPPLGSEASSRIILEKIPKREIHGQNPTVLPCNKQSLSFFEGVTRKDAPIEPMPPMNAPPLRPMMRPPIGLPLPMPRGGPMDGPYRFPPQGPVMLPGGPHGMARPPMQIALGPRGPVPGGQLVLSRMPGPPPPGVHPQQSVLVMQRPGVPPGMNGPPLVRQQMPPGAQGVPVSSSSMTVMPGQHPSGYYQGQPGQGPPPHGVPMPGQPHSDPYYRGVDARSDPGNMVPISEAEFQEIMERNKTVSSSAIARAVQDASAGDFGTAIETLVTAVSLIKQSKIANDDRCKILISSLQDTLKGIEDKSYGQRARHRSRSGSPRESSRKKHRHRSRSPRDRNEYRRSEDYDGKYSREHRRR
ncbi:unnamed protein product [Adineta steineri]|uniref:Cleavage and polyadenylation specificity factor subunit 6 n=2 Tax=Adineta steineri TaxID=433720 RepID=A0A814PEN1_9BILA|nr:unnamed protein product [Adineta steineri]